MLKEKKALRIDSLELKPAQSILPALKIRPAVRIFVLLVLCFLPGLLLQAQPLAFPEMEYVDVYEKPGVGRKLSRLIMGTDHLGKVPEERMIEVLNEAVKLGINTFDTAPIYAESAEYKLANWLKSLNRSDLYVITKGGFPRDYAAGKYYSRLTGSAHQIAANIYEQLKWSQTSLGEIGITIYLMHRDDADYKDYVKVDRPQTTVETILAALSHPFLRHRYLMVGVSNWETQRVDESQRVARENPNLVRPVCHSPYFSLLEMGKVSIHSGGVQVKHDEMMNPDFQKGVKIMTYSSLGGFSILSRGWEAAQETEPYDEQGHGTNVAGNIVGGDGYLAAGALGHPSPFGRFECCQATTDEALKRIDATMQLIEALQQESCYLLPNCCWRLFHALLADSTANRFLLSPGDCFCATTPTTTSAAAVSMRCITKMKCDSLRSARFRGR